MTQQPVGARINRRAFIQSFAILLCLMLVAGIVSRLVPAGQYERILIDGREVIRADSFAYGTRPAYPIWRWLIAPIEVLGSTDGLTIITIIVFLLMVGAAFAVLEQSGILPAALGQIVQRFGRRKYLLMLVISFFFMVVGAFFGIFEEVVPLVPLMVALSYSLGWDSLVGLGMSILATNLGFSAAITNPFSIGVAQRIADLPLYSGSGLRLLVFAAIYGVLALFLVTYARRIDKDPCASPVHALDGAERKRYANRDLTAVEQGPPHLKRGLIVFALFMALVVFALASGPLLPALSGLLLPIVGVFFLLGGLGAGLSSGAGGRRVWRAAREGVTGIAPGIPLILMAASVKHIIMMGGVMDTLLYSASGIFTGQSPFLAVLMILVVSLVIELFVGSASAKAFLLLPILVPLADLLGVTRQTTVLAYCFGDGFSNLAYPTNPVLLIALGLTVVSYPTWIRWTLKLWALILIVVVAALGLAVAIGYGPF